MIRVAVMAASPVARMGLQAMLAADPDFVVDGAYAEIAALRAPVDVVVWAPDTAGWDWDLDAALVALLDDPQPLHYAEAIRSGARAVLTLDATAEELSAAVHAAALGLLAIPAAQALTLLGTPPDAHQTSEVLTPRETEILRLVATGIANKEIAARLGISEHTVKAHIASVLGKLNAASRTEAVAIGLRQGVILL